MIPYRFSYLIGVIPLLLIWCLLYLHRKDVRKEMLFFSFWVGFLGMFTYYYWWTVDWWYPPNITGTRVGIEDFLLCFAVGGIAAVIYEEVFKKHYFVRKSHHHAPGIFTLSLLCAWIIAFLFWGAHVTSFYASSIAQLAVAVLILYYRRDLFYNALWSGILMVVCALPFYYLIMLISPGWIDLTFNKSLSGMRITGIPIEELIFWFLFGMVIGPVYEYWKGEKLRKQKRPLLGGSL